MDKRGVTKVAINGKNPAYDSLQASNKISIFNNKADAKDNKVAPNTMSTKRTLRKSNDKLNLAFGTALVEKFISGRAFDRKFAKHLKSLGFYNDDAVFQKLLQQGRELSAKWSKDFDVRAFSHEWFKDESNYTPYLSGDQTLTIICEHPCEYPCDSSQTKDMLVEIIGNGLTANDITCDYINQDQGQLFMVLDGVEAMFILNKMIERFSYYGVEDIRITTDEPIAMFKITYA